MARPKRCEIVRMQFPGTYSTTFSLPLHTPPARSRLFPIQSPQPQCTSLAQSYCPPFFGTISPQYVLRPLFETLTFHVRISFVYWHLPHTPSLTVSFIHCYTQNAIGFKWAGDATSTRSTVSSFPLFCLFTLVASHKMGESN